MSSFQELVDINIGALQEGNLFLSSLPAKQFTQSLRPTFESTIGAHFRHVLEHYRCFLRQLPSACVCYDARERDQILERDLGYAVRTINDLVHALGTLSESSTLQIKDGPSGLVLTTTTQRELLFLQSHTVHHYAIAAAMGRQLGTDAAPGFGVALATQQHVSALSKSGHIGMVSKGIDSSKSRDRSGMLGTKN
ncbi:hypothetical protein GCM10008090_05940 [Arenicella chitinivorans]|uniref:DinB family protein n=1 Tax=Arenicella chitinivorans TaxID=1329800 RepID=A0A918VHV7_9GAMM|nr:DinB family protein [Arenicella chitinivorans]GHA00082.1 hypothetical protein GCM10008090_05940 [Arenicella chitinivorans]